VTTGSIFYNPRERMCLDNRYLAWSHDGGELWLAAYRSAELPDVPRGSSDGYTGSKIRLPVDGLNRHFRGIEANACVEGAILLKCLGP
jgi:hypothetical protein